ncbi:MAG: ornithine cyclodeaminase family protein [Rhodospirillales bacterium]|nr:MAG: ornithine cyclodeaminase family protein [Rhodospirillales bacterium]
MQMIDAETVTRLTPFDALVAAIREMFRADCVMPVRHHHTIAVPGEPDATALLMPAWTVGEHIGVKLVNVFPGNADRGLPAVSGVYVLFDGKTGQPLALIDGGELTVRRTAAASALAVDYLARRDARHLLVVATGRLALHQIGAFRAVRPIERITVWGRNPDRAAKIVEALQGDIDARVATDLEAAVAQADIISCATLATAPLIRGAWLRPGQHLDLIGGFTPKMREADDDCIRRATVFCDTRAGATVEAGDLVQPLASGVLTPEGIAADLYELCRGAHCGRASEDEITLFKAAGAALEDLAGALLAYQRAGEG